LGSAAEVLGWDEKRFSYEIGAEIEPEMAEKVI
jgi:hypothetical protein